MSSGDNREELDAFCLELDRWLRNAVDARAIDAACTIPPDKLAALADLGVFGITIPEAYGGVGFDLHAGCRVVETIAKHDRSVATTVGLHLGLGTHGLVEFGTPRQKQAWLPPLAAGERIAAFAATEPGAGSDISRFATRARVAADGAMSVTGQKIYVTNGGLAHTYTIAAAMAGAGIPEAAASLLLVDRSDPGFTVGAEEHKLGLRGSSTTTLFLDEVALPAERVLGGELGHGHKHLSAVLGWGRTLMSAGCCGTAAAALGMAMSHVKERKQFQRTLLSQPVVRDQLASGAAWLFAMRAAVVRASTIGGAEAVRERASLAAKVFCSEVDWEICDTALQLHGGSGYIEESGIALALRDARVTRIFEGANDVLLTRIGALELVSPAPGPTEDAPIQLARIEAIVGEALRLAKKGGGLAAFRDPVLMHFLGRLVTYREVARACCASSDTRYTNDTQPALLERALTLIEDATKAQQARTRVMPHSDRICDQLAAGELF